MDHDAARIRSATNFSRGDAAALQNPDPLDPERPGPIGPPLSPEMFFNDRRSPSGSRPRREASRCHPNDGHLGIR